MTGGLRGPFDKLRVNGGCWIPAFAGMTVPGGNDRRVARALRQAQGERWMLDSRLRRTVSLAALLLAAFTLFAACGDNDAGLRRAEVEGDRAGGRVSRGGWRRRFRFPPSRE